VKLKAQLDKFTINRSKEIEIPITHDDYSILQNLEYDFRKDRTYYREALTLA